MKKIFSIEIAAINSLNSLEKLISSFHEYEIPLGEVNETIGASLIPESELKEMICLSKEAGVLLTLSCTQRAEYDYRSTFYQTAWGKEQGRKLNNIESMNAALDEVYKFDSIGCQKMVHYDIGVMREIYDEKKNGNISSSLMIKASSHTMITNHNIAKIFQENGVEDLILPHDISIDMIGRIRDEVPNTILSVIMDSYTTKGGFIRYNEVGKIIESASPVYLKCGSSIVKDPYSSNIDFSIKNKARRTRSLLDEIYRTPELGIPQGAFKNKNENSI